MTASTSMRVFEPAWIGTVELKNRVLRSATFEGMCDGAGNPTPAYAELYAGLASHGLGGLITGFAFVSRDGRAMQPGQAGMDADDKVAGFRHVTCLVHERGCRIFLQLAHAGRQTVPAATGGRIYGPSTRKSRYFNQRPCRLTAEQVELTIRRFADAACRAREAGFDGVQLHAAHGYLIHQFLHPPINDRTDVYGVDRALGIGTAFLEQVITRIRAACGAEFPLLVKVSASDNYPRPMGEAQFIQLIRFLDSCRVDAIEISYGTMDHAFNIFRGQSIPLKSILDFNPRYRTRNPIARLAWRTFVLPRLKRELIPFSSAYNLPYAVLAKKHTGIPVISVGGFRSASDVRRAVEDQGVDFVSLCRPLICEPDFVESIRRDERYQSRCTNCNRCAVMCDSRHPTRCYGRGTARSPGSMAAAAHPVSAPAFSHCESREDAYENRR